MKRFLVMFCVLLFVLSPAWAYSSEPHSDGWGEEFKFAWPVAGEIITKFDVKGEYEAGSHRGIDIQAEPGTKVVAPADGKVAYVAKNTLPGFGGGMILTIDHDNDISTTYLGIENVAAKKGDSVQEGQEIAAVSGSGDAVSSSLPHLHFGTYRTSEKKSGISRYIDPESLLKSVIAEEDDTKEEAILIPAPIEDIDVTPIEDVDSMPIEDIDTAPIEDVDLVPNTEPLPEPNTEPELDAKPPVPQPGLVPEPQLSPIPDPGIIQQPVEDIEDVLVRHEFVEDIAIDHEEDKIAPARVRNVQSIKKQQLEQVAGKIKPSISRSSVKHAINAASIYPVSNQGVVREAVKSKGKTTVKSKKEIIIANRQIYISRFYSLFLLCLISLVFLRHLNNNRNFCTVIPRLAY